MTTKDSIIFASGHWWWVALIAAVFLLALAWLAMRPSGPQALTTFVSFVLRAIGIVLLLLCLLDPQLVSPTAKPGANLIAIVADNSQSLQVSDPGAPVTRGQQLRTMLAGDGAKWINTLEEKFQVRPYVFDRDLRRVNDFTELDFQGERTDLSLALKQVHDRLAGQPLAGVLLLTDGIATNLPSGSIDTTGLPPIYPVVIGQPGGLSDIRVDHTSLRQTAFDDAPVSLTADIVGQSVNDRSVQVSVRPYDDQTAKQSGGTDTLPQPKTVQITGNDTPVQVTFDWHPKGTGAQFFEVDATATGTPPLQEATLLNNRQIVMVDRGRPAYRILYIGGRPNWEFKFLNRALEDDPQLQMFALFRIAKREPKFEFLGRFGESTNPLFRGFGNTTDDTQRYDEPVLERIPADAVELQSGVPSTAEALFSFDAIILDDIEAEFFKPDQLALMRRFVSERGGGLLMLGGVDTFMEGNYTNTPIASVLPVYLDRKAPQFPQGELTFDLTREGWLEAWTRVRATEAEERSMLETMPHNLVANSLSAIKPGAALLATITDQSGHIFPALVTQNYGSGRSAALGIGDTWEGRIGNAEQMTDLSRFWRQMVRWLVTNDPAKVELRAEPSTEEGGGMLLRVTVRDKEYKAMDFATVKITVKRTGDTTVAPTSASGAQPVPAPGAASTGFNEFVLPAEPVLDKPGEYSVTFPMREAGAYVADAEAKGKDGGVLGHAQTGWVNDPAAQEFRTLTPNRKLLEELASRTGGQVLGMDQLNNRLSDFLSKQPAPVTEISITPLWNQSWVFLAVLVCFLAEWFWRRWRGLP